MHNLFQLFIVLYLLMISKHYTHGLIIKDNLKVLTNIYYHYYSSSSIIKQVSVRKSIQCAAQCAQNSACQIATFNQSNQFCLLLSEIGLGQLLPNDETVTFEYERPDSPTSIFSITPIPTSMESTTVSANPLCSTVIPSFGTTWTCINASSSIASGDNERLYIKKNIIVSADSNHNITAYLESHAQLSANSNYDFQVYLESNATLSVNTGQTMTFYLGSGSHVTVDSCTSVIAYLELGARLQVTTGGPITAYLKTNTTIILTSVGKVTTFYESDIYRSYTSTGVITETMCSPVIFDYSNIPSREC